MLIGKYSYSFICIACISVCSIVTQFNIFSIFIIYFWTHRLFRKVLLSFPTYGDFLTIHFYLNFIVTRKKKSSIISFF